MITRKRTNKIQESDQQIDRNDDIGQMLVWSMKEPYEQYERELNECPWAKDIKPSDELFDQIVNDLKEQGEWDKTGETDTFNIYSMLSKEDREALELGKKIKKINRRTIIMKRVAIVACAVLCVFGVSMASDANRQYIVSVWNSIVGNSQLRIQINIQDDKNSEIIQTAEDEAMNIVEDKLGIQPIEMVYRPKEMEFSYYRIEEEDEKIIFFYEYQDTWFTVAMQRKDSESKYSQEFDGIVVDEVPSRISDEKIKIWKISDTGENYAAQLQEEDAIYIIRGYISQEEFTKIIDNITFFI